MLSYFCYNLAKYIYNIVNIIVNIKNHVAFFHLVPLGVFTKNMSASFIVGRRAIIGQRGDVDKVDMRTSQCRTLSN